MQDMNQARAQYNTQPGDVVAFWQHAGPQRWFAPDRDFDADMRWLFFGAYLAAARGDLVVWEETPEGALALILLLDQFPRNSFRGIARSFATDDQALAVAHRAIAHGFDAQFALPLRRFFYLPMMHAETLEAQDECLARVRSCNDADGIKFAEIHRDIIARFGRFPHRNSIIGRETTDAERKFLHEGGFAG
ncbi:MAG: hypothetical protein JWO88_3674 [Frankiales bacterium]|nr:hypothetical protein [Frankiales bacterium]